MEPPAAGGSTTDALRSERSEPVPASDTAPRGGAICPACGAPADGADLFCPGCGAGLAATAGPTDAGEPRSPPLRCDGCGARLRVPAETRTLSCPFCCAAIVIERPEPGSDEGAPGRPEFVLPFGFTAEAARAEFKKWLGRGGWLRPGDLARTARTDTLKGVYLPFWTFAMRAESDWRARIGEYWYRTETYTVIVKGKPQIRTRRVRETEWWPLDGRYRAYHRGYLVSGSRGLPQPQVRWIEPFELEGMKRYAPRFLAGWLSEEPTLDRDQAAEICLDEFEQRQKRQIGAFLPGDTHSDLRAATSFSGVSTDLVLLPVYLLSYRYRDKVYRFLVNGQTGRASGQKPWSAVRITLLVVFILLLAAGAVLAFTLF